VQALVSTVAPKGGDSGVMVIGTACGWACPVRLPIDGELVVAELAAGGGGDGDGVGIADDGGGGAGVAAEAGGGDNDGAALLEAAR
jgi:hypothetical protein